MFAGFDYGTSHCSLAVGGRNGVRLATLEDQATLIPSTLWAPRINLDLRFQNQQLDLAAQSFTQLRFGEAALAAYLQDPTEGYFVKSPKSFLGAPGLSAEVQERFVSIVGSMMANVRLRAENSLGTDLEQVVIGRPVNFQSASGNAQNSQALEMLTAAAKLAGFREVEFLFEPMAAAIEYESKLSSEQLVLVVDVGGGTTDCSFVRVGPQQSQHTDRSQDVLGHSGERMGGNDYDQALALESVMPSFGLGAGLRNGRLLPNHYFVDAVSTNDVNAQQRFYSKDRLERLEELLADVVDPSLLQRLLTVRNARASYRLLRSVEQTKIALSTAEQAEVALGYIESGLRLPANRQAFLEASERLLDHLQGLVNEVLAQTNAAPDVVYLTGGMAKASIVREHLAGELGGVRQLDSDHFASVTEGLTIWAERVFGGS